MSGWDAFSEGFAGSIPQGMGMYADLRRLAMQEQQQQLQQQTAERQQKALDLQTQGQKLTAITAIAKIKDPKARAAALQFQAPIMGFDPADPQVNALIEGLSSEDPQFKSNFNEFSKQLGVSPEGAGALGALDPAEAMQGLLRLKQMQTGSDTAAERMDLSRQRLDLANQSLNLSGERFKQLQGMQDLRVQGLIPPMGSTFTNAPGQAPQLTPIPGSPASTPSNEERATAAFMKRALDSQQEGMQFLSQNPDYLSSFRATIDRIAQNPDIGKELGSAAGAAGGLLAGARAGHPIFGVLAGGTVGKSVGEVADTAIQQFLTSDKGKQFTTAWSPFVAGVIYGDTGKVVQAQEWTRALDQWIPVAGDPPERLALKEQNRASAMQAMALKAGRAGPNESAFTPSNTWAPQVKTLAPGVEQTAEQLARKVQAGQATPDERAKLSAILKAKGYNFQ